MEASIVAVVEWMAVPWRHFGIGESGFDFLFFLFGLGFVFVSASEFEEGKSLSAHDTAK